jgi:hypothetical protein
MTQEMEKKKTGKLRVRVVSTCPFQGPETENSCTSAVQILSTRLST